MRPYFWIAIMAVVGSVLGIIFALIFPGIGSTGSIVGTGAGVCIGTAMYYSRKNKKD